MEGEALALGDNDGLSEGETEADGVRSPTAIVTAANLSAVTELSFAHSIPVDAAAAIVWYAALE